MNTASLKYIIKTILLILVISFLADKIIFIALNKISDKVYLGQRIGKINHYLEIKDDLNLIIFGSSRANHNINPVILSKNSFNMGVDGTKIAYSAALIKLLPVQKEQVILLNIDTFNAFSADYNGSDIDGLSVKYNRNKALKLEIDNLNQNNLIQNFYWSLSYNGLVIDLLKNYFMDDIYDYKSYFGYDPIYVSENQREIFKSIINEEKSQDCQNNFTLNKIYDTKLREIKNFCKNNNKKLIIFTSPIFNDKCKDDNIQFSQIMKNEELIYYDFTDFFKNNNSLAYWKDEIHLSNKGAEIFTEKIKKILDEN